MTPRTRRTAPAAEVPAAEVPATEPAPAEATRTPGAAEPDAAAPGLEGAPGGGRPEPALDEAGNGQGMSATAEAAPAEPTLAPDAAAWLAARTADRAAEAAARAAQLAAEADAMTAKAMRAVRLPALTRDQAGALAESAADMSIAVLAAIWPSYTACRHPSESEQAVMLARLCSEAHQKITADIAAEKASAT